MGSAFTPAEIHSLPHLSFVIFRTQSRARAFLNIRVGMLQVQGWEAEEGERGRTGPAEERWGERGRPTGLSRRRLGVSEG